MKNGDTDKLKWQKDILSIFPERIGVALLHMPHEPAVALEEIRIRAEQPLAIYENGKNRFLTLQGALRDEMEGALHVTAQDCQEILTRASRHSIYALEEEMRRGFITLRGGYRVGLAGRTVLDKGSVRLISPCTGFNIRIARQVCGCAKKLLPHVVTKQKVLQTLIVSPPQMGKTTLLRDLARLLSTGEGGETPRKVAIIDERSEIAGCYNGIAQNDVGPNTDVLDGCPKAEGIMMALRGLSPQVVITDEIGRKEDTAAIMEAVNSGVSVIASAHGSSMKELSTHPGLRPLMEYKLFERIVILNGRQGPGTIAGILDKNGILIERGISTC